MIETVVDGVRFPVGKIVGVGRNYAAHAAEMGAPRPDEPLIFLKPSTALLFGGGELRLPPWSKEIHHEVEMVVRIGSDGAPDGCGVGLDLTARDVQARAKQAGHPWAVAKGWDGSAPLSELVSVAALPPLDTLELRLDIDGETRQRGSTAAMLWPVPELIAFIATRFTLEPGDLLFTGTPEGVGPVHPGEHLSARLSGVSPLELTIVGS